MKYFIIAMLLTSVSYVVYAQAFGTKQICFVTKVIDGDTVHATCDSKDVKIRLTTIDSFESKRNNRAYRQAYEQHITVEEVVQKGKIAKRVAEQELKNKKVTVVAPSKGPKLDMYKRLLGELYVDGVNINNKMLTEHPDVFLKY